MRGATELVIYSFRFGSNAPTGPIAMVSTSLSMTYSENEREIRQLTSFR